MIVADTGALIALADRNDSQHDLIVRLYDEHAAEWILPWAILPEIDYLLGAHLGTAAQDAFEEDLAHGAYAVEWGNDEDLVEAAAIGRQYRALRLGLVDTVVMAIAVRRRARAIVTLDERHFGAVTLPGGPALWPRDLLTPPGVRLAGAGRASRKRR